MNANVRHVYRSLVVPTDLSGRAARALEHACSLVAPKGKVHLVHVLEYPDIPNPMYAHYGRATFSPEERERLQRAAQAELDTLARTCAPPEGVVLERHMVDAPHGKTVDRLCAKIDEVGADLVCIASHGRSGLKRVLLGSVAEALLRRCRVPTLVVRVPDAELVDG
jgi:nucleotide-binding universal stress UspA family protein